MKTPPQTLSLEYLSSICYDKSSLKAKVAALTLRNREYTNFSEKVMLFFEYFQLISLTVGFYYLFNEDSTQNVNSWLSYGIVYFIKAVNPAYWLPLNDGLALFIIVSTTLKYALFIYIVTTAILHIKPHLQLVKAWQFISYIQPRIICYITVSIWAKFISMALNADFTLFNIDTTSTVFICGIMIAQEFGFSIFFQIHFVNLLPTKSLLSAKNNHTEISTLVHKIVLQILQVSLTANSFASWFLASLNILFCIARDFDYFMTLPYYSMNALWYQSILLACVNAVSIAYLLEVISVSSGYVSNIDYVIIIWVGLAIQLIFIYRRILSICIHKLVSGIGTPSQDHLIHKISIINDYRKLNGAPSPECSKYMSRYLMSMTIQRNLSKIFNINWNMLDASESQEIYSKQTFNKIVVQYLEELSLKFPKNDLIKLYTAYFYAKKFHLYAHAMKICSSLKKVFSHQISLNASLLIYEMQNLMRNEYKNNDKTIDLSLYVKNVSRVAELKKRMLQQSKSQTELYEEILRGHDLQKIFELAQAINTSRLQIESKAKSLFTSLPDHYIDILGIYAQYSLTLNHSDEDYAAYLKKFNQWSRKYEKYIQSDKLQQENLYQSSNIFMLVSSQKDDPGKIVYFTKSIEKIFGGETRLYAGANISTLFPPSLQSYYQTFFKALAETGDKSLIGSCIREYAYHKDGYIFEIDFYINIHPYLTQGYYLGVIIRPVPTTKDCLILLPNGNIDCASKTISRKLGLLEAQSPNSNTAINAKYISEDLNRINEAYNIIEASAHETPVDINAYGSAIDNSPNKKSVTLENSMNLLSLESPALKKHSSSQRREMSQEEARVLHSLCSSKGKNITLRPIVVIGDKVHTNHNTQAYRFNCTVKILRQEPKLLKLIELVVLDKDEYQGKGESLDEKIEMLNTNENRATQILSENKSNGDIIGLEDFEENLASYNENDEKQEGWIDFRRMGRELVPVSTASNAKLVTLQLEHSTTTENLMSPVGNERRALISPQRLEPGEQDMRRVFLSSHEEVEHRKFGLDAKEKEVAIRKMTVKMSVGSSETARQTHRTRAFKEALGVRYYSKGFNIFCGLYYLLVLLIFACELSYKLLLDSRGDDLRTIKEIVSNCERRNYLLVYIQLESRLAYDIDRARINVTGQGTFGVTARSHVYFLKKSLIDLAGLNQALISNVNYLSERVQQVIFAKDIIIYDTFYSDPVQTFALYDNFQAMNQIVEIGLQGVAIVFNTNSVANAKTQIRILLRNTANDPLVKNEVISGMLTDDVNNIQVEVNNTLIGYLIGNIITIAILTGGFTFIVWMQYKNEKVILTAVLKLDSHQINSILPRLKYFMGTLENETDWNEKENAKEPRRNLQNFDRSAKKNSNNNHLTITNDRRTRTKYYLYVGIIFVFMMLLIALVVISDVIPKESTLSVLRKQVRFSYSQQLKLHAAMITAMSFDLVSSSGASYNHNLPVGVEIPIGMQQFIDLRNKITTIFRESNGSYDPEIENILFTDGCAALTGTRRTNCDTLAQASIPTNLINLLNLLESSANQKINQYSSQLSSSQRINLESLQFGTVYTVLMVVIAQFDYISADLEQTFQSDLANSSDERDIILGVSVAVLIGLSFLIWICLLCRFKEINNQLKTVLRVFPSNLVLHNFILKMFLVDTSKGILKFNQIDM